MTTTTPDAAETALSRFTSAQYEAERAAQDYAAATLADVADGFREHVQDNADEDPCDMVHEYADGLECVIYTHRAHALVVGARGLDEAREDYASEFGGDTDPDMSQLAFVVVSQHLYEVAHDLDA